MKKTERIIGIDLIRIFACLLVILYHVPQFTAAGYEFHDVGSRILNSSLFYVGRCAVPLFFIISGYLLLPLKTNISSFFRKKLSRLVIPTVLWFIIINILGKSFDNPNNTFWIAKTPHFWYMYALFGVYLILPILSYWYLGTTTKVKLVYLFLWAVSLFFIVINEHFPIRVEYSHQGMLYTTPYHSLLYISGYMGYFLLGAIIRDSMSFIIRTIKIMLPIALCIYVLLIVIFRQLYGVSEPNSIAYCSPTTCLLASILFVLFLFSGERINRIFAKKCDGNFMIISRIITTVSNATFSIYFMHVLFLEYLPIETIGGYSRMAIGIFVFTASFVVYKILSFLPFNKYLLG